MQTLPATATSQFDAEEDGPIRVLAVDDNETNLELLRAQLEHAGYNVTAVESGTEALEQVRTSDFDVVVLDVMMPGITGIDVCALLKHDERTRLIPIILLTALSSMDDRVAGLEAGADDFITKPFNRVELVTRVRSLARVKRLNSRLESAENVVLALARAIEAKDPHTEGHVERVSQLASRLGARMGFSRRDQQTLARAGILHDIGKIGVPEAILLKAGPLSAEEMREVEKHSVLGEQICLPLRSAASLLTTIRHHHERVDGKGYPDGLIGDAIPATARVLAIVDAYDAMTSDRPYRTALPRDRALQILRNGAGKQWDSAMVAAFAAMIEESD